MSENITYDIKPGNYSKVEEFVKSAYGPFSCGYGGGEENTDIMYGGVSLRNLKSKFTGEFIKHQIVINFPGDFRLEQLKKLERLATQ